MKAKCNKGAVVKTQWDDTDELLWGAVTKVYWGHRNWRYDLIMDDGAVETIDEDQIVDFA